LKVQLTPTPAPRSGAIEFALAERATANEFDSTAWQRVRNRRIANQKFRREYPLPTPPTFVASSWNW
jgi:very-short-patch-repair endonuclease